MLRFLEFINERLEDLDYHNKNLTLDEYRLGLHGVDVYERPGSPNDREKKIMSAFERDNWVKFRKSEIKRIKDILPENYGLSLLNSNGNPCYDYIRDIKHKDFTDGEKDMELRVYIHKSEQTYGYLYLNKLKDDWYYINAFTNTGRKYYKADGFESVLNYIKRYIK